MGQKVNPVGLRLGINKTWASHWYVDPKDYAKTLHEDLKIRSFLSKMPETKGADIAEVEIIRHPQRITLMIHTARPGIIIGLKGANIETIGAKLQKLVNKKIELKIKEVRNADGNAQIVALNIARQLQARGSFRRTMKMAINNAMKKGEAKGVKVRLSGRLGGAEMSRTEEAKEGQVPLHTLRADIDYGFAEAHTTFGAIGVKVWIFRGFNYGREEKEDAGETYKRRHDRFPPSHSAPAPQTPPPAAPSESTAPQSPAPAESAPVPPAAQVAAAPASQVAPEAPSAGSAAAGE